MRGLLLIMAPVALAACSQEAAEQESADDFAARIGSGAEAQGDPAKPAADLPNTAAEAPPAGADVTKLQKLGDIAAVDLGPRDGGCTFMTGGTEMIIAAGKRDPAMSGKGVIRVGNGLVLLDSGPGGLNTIQRGTTLTGNGVTVTIEPAGGNAQTRPANATVSAADGKSQTYSGNWICA